ncbi:hypothetical protein [Trichlorobacter ammonificans]|uniref:Radical SAM core domain-containing protein n=1 Tax=Trichlorobacter ammonificans TaxID=2916410 RepID=A0ABN8HIE0_9BACT|nr:hypothetical protein [Trichlorobacter ammonificans]CAH2031350.1 conserved protein of unknown function [Trichlorobacter ammonificans]
MLQRIKRHMPESIKKPIRQVVTAFDKPELPYLELHLADHCNLGCKSCGHFSPIATPTFADIDQYQLDMKRLRKLFRNITTIRLLGGEPLLHPQPDSFIAIARETFPLANIRVVTNGILLSKASDRFWTTCRETKTAIDLTVYPPLRSQLAGLKTLCALKGVSLNPSEVTHFSAFMNLHGTSDEREAFLYCRSIGSCPFLRNGHLYPCGIPALIHHFNKHFDYHIPSDKGIDIHASFLSGRKVLELLGRPISSCKYCTSENVEFPWSTCGKGPEEWDAYAQKELLGRQC